MHAELAQRIVHDMFIRNCWYVAAWSSELAGDGMIARTIINEPIVFFRTSNGEVVALEDRCCHRQAPLSLGRREGDYVRCLYHGLKFDATGRCIEIPGQETIPARACVRRYATAEKHSWLWVWMGEALRADVALIPPAVGLDEPGWVLRTGTLDYQASHWLLHDNLCDLSHIAYLHESSFGGGSDQMARTRPKVSTLPRGIRVEHWTHASTTTDANGPQIGLEHWLRYEYLAPGVLLLRSENHVAGTAARCAHGEPRCEPIFCSFTSQAVTPVTEATSRYFFSWGPRASDAAGNPAMPDSMFALASRAFEEDRRMVEAQQRNRRPRAAPEPLVIGHDRGPALMRAIMEKLARDEQAHELSIYPAPSPVASQ